MEKNKLIFIEISKEDLKKIFLKCPDLKNDGMTLYFEKK